MKRSKKTVSMKVLLGAVAESVLVLAFCMVSFIPQASATDYDTRLYKNTTLYPGESVWSPNRNYRLTQQQDGNLVEYSMPGNKPFWASNTTRWPGSVTQMQSDGNLVIYAPGHVAVWSTNTPNHPDTVLFMQNDANVVLYAPGNVPIWATNAMYGGGCTDGSRDQALQYAQSGNFWEVGSVSYNDKVGTVDTVGSVVLRYNPTARCAWAVGSGGAVASIYIDRSSDGGRTWQGRLGERSLGTSNSTYTGVFNDSYPYVVRACIVSPADLYHCTGWF